MGRKSVTKKQKLRHDKKHLDKSKRKEWWRDYHLLRAKLEPINAKKIKVKKKKKKEVREE